MQSSDPVSYTHLDVYKRQAETFNGLMAIPNLIAVFLLSGTVVKMVKEYFATEGK